MRLLLLDGQQRITSLYGVIRGHAPTFFEGDRSAFTGLHFNVEDETSEFYAPAKMRDDKRWVDVTRLFVEGLDPFIAAFADEPQKLVSYLSGVGVGELVDDTAGLAAKKLCKQRVDSGEAALASGLEGGEGHPRHCFRCSGGDLVRDPRLVVHCHALDFTATDFGSQGGNFVKCHGRAGGEPQIAELRADEDPAAAERVLAEACDRATPLLIQVLCRYPEVSPGRGRVSVMMAQLDGQLRRSR